MVRTYVALFLLLCGSISRADDKVKVTFDYKNNLETQGLIGLLDADQLKATLHLKGGDFKFYEVLMTSIRNGKKEYHRIIGFLPIMPDSTQLCVTTMAVDSMNCIVYVSPSIGAKIKVEMPTNQCLLIDYRNEDGYTPGDTIPLMAYSTGICKEMDLGNGHTVKAHDICGLRFSKIPLSEWHKTFNIPSYIYFEAVPVKSIDYGKLFNAGKNQ